MLDWLDSTRPYVTTPQAAQRSGLSTNYLATLLRRGQLEGFRLAREWFIYTDSLERYLATPHKPGPKGPWKKREQQQEDIRGDQESEKREVSSHSAIS